MTLATKFQKPRPITSLAVACSYPSPTTSSVKNPTKIPSHILQTPLIRQCLHCNLHRACIPIFKNKCPLVMKKVKVFLTASAIVTIVYNALALKVNYGTDYCYAPLPASGVCSRMQPCTAELSAGDDNGGLIYCIAPRTESKCSQQFCPTKSPLEAE